MLRQFASGYLAGLPPLLVQVGTADLLLSDSKRLATAAAQAGVDVTTQTGEGLPHLYPIMLGTPEATEATEATEQICRRSLFMVLQPVPMIALEGKHSARTVPDPGWCGMLPS